ncbi:MAG TPA: UDP-N-acetylmuramoyl-L-alanyl-D-glutamate--2,6-diaminopimelate ligase [Candidatus Limnocylindria bacterium]|nr:UDP-N-acetylmuramoyl-L-alanyl-D-glutamate--2,6-diaminopimelate ligase [Candidatus Limnocylindria bacterium]
MYTFPSTYPVACHTDNVGPGSTFVAIQGNKHDGAEYIPLAVHKGATTIVLQEDAQLSPEVSALVQAHNVQLERVPNTRHALALLSAHANGNPADKLRIIAVTGTKGKTTSVFLLEHVMRAAGYSVALLSSAHNSINGSILPTNLTTQHPDYLHVFFKECVQQGVQWVIMEAAAQAFSLHRVAGLQFDGILFTNFDQTHAEFYTVVDDYFAAKCQIFTQRKGNAPVVINADNAWCAQVLERVSKVTTYGIATAAVDYRAQVAGDVGAGIVFDVQGHRLTCPSLLGLFSVYNLLGVACLAHQLGIPFITIAQAFLTFGAVPGRLERYPLANGATCIIDYAHNPLSFESILSTLRPLTPHLIVVFGCGGDRDKTMRPVMGGIAAKYADAVIITTDNPRSEQVTAICDDIMAGINQDTNAKVHVILDRKEAIERAYTLANATTIIAVLGKGRDEYQLVGTTKTFFSDIQTVKGL